MGKTIWRVDGEEWSPRAVVVANSCYFNHDVKIPPHCGSSVMTAVRRHGNEARRDLLLTASTPTVAKALGRTIQQTDNHKHM